MKIGLFAALKDAAGKNEMRIAWKQGMTARDVVEELKKNFETLGPLLERSFVAVNGSYASLTSCLNPEDEVAVLPPVSGG